MAAKLVALLAGAILLSGCTTVLIGGAGAILADEIIEQEQGGGDGLF